jgi:hypothetical protein
MPKDIQENVGQGILMPINIRIWYNPKRILEHCDRAWLLDRVRSGFKNGITTD